jgi:hypothetical protein
MAKGALTGYAIKTLGNQADHTYVTSDDGNVWPCWGRCSGGNLICTGTGNIDQADCLSQPSSQAGIAYGINGVCHQTANRILYPSGETVSHADGYRASLFMWGTYGREPLQPVYSPANYPWPELVACLNHSHP